jgi:hypothetical protein
MFSQNPKAVRNTAAITDKNNILSFPYLSRRTYPLTLPSPPELGERVGVRGAIRQYYFETINNPKQLIENR